MARKAEPPAAETPLSGVVSVTGKNGTETVLYQPTAKQLQFHRCGAKNILYGGAVAGGKSHGLRWDAHLACLSVPNLRVLILRRTFPELLDTHIDKALFEAKALGAEFLKSEYRLKFPNGSTEQYGHCQDDNAVARYLSTEYERIYFDELVTFTFKQFAMIGSRARSTKPGYVPRVLAATNPGGAEASWVRSWFIDHTVDRDQYPTYDPKDFAYIPATLDDNPHIDAQVYERRLALLPKAVRDAYRWGSWDLWEGMYFTQWRQQDHVGRPTLPPGTIVVRAIDWGFVKPGVCLWVACLPDGKAAVLQEYVFERTIASEVAQEIRRRTQMLGYPVRYTVGDTQMWTPDSQTGESIAETFARHHVGMVQATKDRVNGWQRLAHWLQKSPDGTPWLIVDPDCVYTKRTVPSLMSDPHKPEDVDTDGEDHAADALRYFCMSRPSPLQVRTNKGYSPGSWGWELSKLESGRRKVLGKESVRRRGHAA